MPFPIFFRYRSVDLRERQMDRILEMIESKLGYRPHLERDERGRWSIPAELIRQTGLPVQQYVTMSDFF